MTPSIAEPQPGAARVRLQEGTDASSWLSARRTVEAIPIRHPVIEALGHHPTSEYAEQFWLPVIGPSALWAHRRLTAGDRSGYQLDLSTLGQEIGLGTGTGRNYWRTTPIPCPSNGSALATAGEPAVAPDAARRESW